MKGWGKRTVLGLVWGGLLLSTLLFVPPAQATQDYARKTGKGCIFCHQESTGGQLKTVGFAYIRNGYEYPIPKRILEKAEAFQTPFHKTLRFIIGYLHLLAAMVFFGTIFYIHLFVGPKQLRGGIPKSERVLGLSCMAALTVTGIYLTWVRIDRWEQFFNNTFGLMLFIKILLFLLMVAIGLTAVTALHRRMKREAKASAATDTNEIIPANLSRFDGTGGKRAYIVHENTIYDVTGNPKWKDGRHFGKHAAGTDLTEALNGAPHGTEVLEKVTSVGTLSAGGPAPEKTSGARKIFLWMAYTNLVIIFLILACISVWRWDFPLKLVPEKRAEAVAGTACLECHRTGTPGIAADWSRSLHAKVGVGCYDCHKAQGDEGLFSKRHLERVPEHPVAIVVTPRTCRGCHPEEAAQYERSKHANTIEIMWKVDPWLNDGLNNPVERTTGCYACHGTVVELRDGRPKPGTWPNVGVGRKNPDGSLGSCSSCHTRHAFSMVEARKPEACDQCHLGPDHPQIEIYNESKHGTIYHAEGQGWNWSPDDGQWQAGRDFRAPTCAACHMSAAADVPSSHDVTERLSWETQAPLTVRPSDFKPFPARTNWEEERAKMKTVCLQCHSRVWTDDHFSNLDAVIANYNDTYYRPVRELMDALYASQHLSKATYFDEELEWEFYEFWHHEGRRARMGAAMMAPDYAWWHGFYEVKHRFVRIVEKAETLRKGGKGVVYSRFPGTYEQSVKP
jgi:predicted heme/steroid binding protein/uncharacterized membrane protein